MSAPTSAGAATDRDQQPSQPTGQSANQRVELSAGPAAPTAGAACRLRPVAPGAARVTGGFWADRQRANRESAIPSGQERLESAGNLDNLRIAAGLKTGEARGPIFMDSDVYKWLEAAAWEYGRSPSQELLEAQRAVTEEVAA